MPLDPTYTGDQGKIAIGGDNTSFPIANITIDVEVNTTDVQHNDSLNPDHAVTGMRYSGSFEFEGQNTDLYSTLFEGPEPTAGDIERPQTISTLSYRENPGGDGGTDRRLILKNVKITSVSRDVPSDDVASTSVDFIAEGLRRNFDSG